MASGHLADGAWSLSFEDTLGDARKLGYVEADEALDLDGIDAAPRLSFLPISRMASG